MKITFASLLAGIALALAAMAGDAPPPAKPVVREVSPGIYEVGKVRLDQKHTRRNHLQASPTQ